MKNMIRRNKNCILVACIFLAAIVISLSVLMCFEISVMADEVPYDTYVYDYWGNVAYTPSPYVPERVITGQNLRYEEVKIGEFNNPQDICVAASGIVYVADTGNNRIVVLSSDLNEVISIINGFDNNGVEETFDTPTGVCVSSKNLLYIADSVNRRIVILDALSYELMGFIQNPESEMLEEGYVFTPLKVSVDYADRVYCVAQNMFEGIMVFESNGDFTGFFGTIEVKISLWDKFWRRIATKEERSRSRLFIPTEFTGIDVDEEGFIYATNIDSEGKKAVRRLNPKGEDVIKEAPKSSLGGDLWKKDKTEYAGPSQITDVVYRGSGIYSILDRKRGRIITYDREGNLLYIFGGLGTQVGTFAMPVAVEEINGEMIILDSGRGAITTFSATEYGTLINEATRLRYDGLETESVEKWKAVLRLNENFELANSGIGKAYLAAGDNKTAMHYFKLAMDKEYYSIAFRRYRNQILKDNLKYILTGLVVLICIITVIFKILAKKKKQSNGDNMK